MTPEPAHTWFAPAERTTPAELRRKIGLLTNNPVTDTIMRAVDGLMAVLDENRQILAVNQAFLELLSLGNADDLLGLRPGEALSCVHADEEPGGCGTSRACATCGAVDAVLAAQKDSRPAGRLGILKVRTENDTRDLVMRVRACPLDIAGENLTLVFFQDMTWAHRLAGLEQAFLHDFNNILQGLRVSAEMAAVETDPLESRALNRNINKLVMHLAREVELQRSLLADDATMLGLTLDNVPIARIQAELGRIFRFHPAALDRHLVILRDEWNAWIRTDPWVLVRILTNLVLNALEATERTGRVEVRTEVTDDEVVFCVWNRAYIPATVQQRIFQKNFSTKDEPGHGLGTYSVKLLGETLLGAQVDFTSSEAKGTEFRVCLPR